MTQINQNQIFSLSVVIPVFNEETGISSHIKDLISSLGNMMYDYEIIIVDDGSSDSTNENIELLQNKYLNKIKLISHPYNKGNGSAIKTGIRASSNDYIICMDGDGQHSPLDIENLLKYLPDYDLVIGQRTGTYKGVWYRNFANWFYNKFASSLVGFNVKDLTSGFRVFDARVIKKYIDLLPNKFSYPTTSTLLFYKNGYNVKYCPINVKPRVHGESKINIFSDGYQFLIIIIKLILLYDPFKVFFPCAIALLILGLTSTLISVSQMERLFIPNSAVFLFTSGLIVFLLGIISSQISTMMTSVNRKK